MPATLNLSTLPEPLRALVQSVLSERDEVKTEQRRLPQENKLLKEQVRLLPLSKYGAKSENFPRRRCICWKPNRA